MSEAEVIALLKSINIKIEALQAQMVMFQEALQPDMEYKVPKSNKKPDTETKGGDSISPPKKGKYTWFQVEGGGKVRNCNNEPCPYYLKYSEEKGTYEHGKYDPNTKVWSYVDDRCEFYGGG